MRKLALAAATAALALAANACGDDDGATDAASSSPSPLPTQLDPSEVVDVIDNPYLPLVPGTRWVYEGVSDGEVERTEVEVTDERRRVMGVDAVVVRDTVTRDGVVLEDTRDWYAQDADGNVWYLGEATEEFEDGEVSTAGSWEAGVDGAEAGVAMPAHPEVGMAYRQEFYEGEAEDEAQIARTGDVVDVEWGSFDADDDVLVIEERNPLEPDVTEEKYYVPGIGMVLEVQTRGGDGRAELVEFHTAD
jgi:hypothetical protein